MGHEFASRGNVLGISAGTQSASSSTIIFSNSNGISFGMSGSSRITASYSTLVFSNSNGVSFGTNGATVTASAGANLSMFENQLPAASSNLLFLSTQMQVQRLSIPAGITVTRLEFMRRTNAGSLSIYPRIYTMSGSTASVLFSTSGSWSSFSPGDSLTSTSMGVGTWSLTPGDYLFGIGASGNADGMRLIGGYIGPYSPLPGTVALAYFNDGVISQISADSIHVTNLSSPANSHRPYVRMLGTF